MSNVRLKNYFFAKTSVRKNFLQLALILLSFIQFLLKLIKLELSSSCELNKHLRRRSVKNY